VCTGVVFSAGMMFVLKANYDTISFGAGCSGMIHLVDTRLSTRELKNSKSFSNFESKEIDRLDELDIKMYTQAGLSKKELAILKDGLDLYISNDRLAECVATYKSVEHMRNKEAELERLKQEVSRIESEIKICS
jgi:hypothetical protein